jgi:two-component system OmpR family response regulator
MITLGGDGSGEARLLVVEDEDTIRELLSGSLQFAGFEVTSAASGVEALRAVSASRPDLVLLDVMMPGYDGFEVLRRLRLSGPDVPVIFLTARDGVRDRVTGLALGGDDYVTKPFSLEEVLERIRAVLRRTRTAARAVAPRLRVADLELYDDSREVRRDGIVIELTPTEFKLLRFLMVNAGRVLSKRQILDHVWEHNPGGDGNVLEPCISYLRRKVDQREPRLIHTIRGAGYIMRIPPP